MKDNTTPNERIDAYLLNHLPQAERHALEADLNNSPTLKQQFQQQELEHKMMESLIEKDLLKDLKQWQTEADNTSTNIRPLVGTTAKRIPLYRRSSFLAIAASFLLLLAAAIWVFIPDNNSAGVAETTTPVEPNNGVTPPTPIEDSPEQLAETPKEETPEIPEPTPQEQIASNNTPKKETPATTNTPDPKPERDYTIENTSSQPDYFALAESYDRPIDFNNVRSTEVQDSPYNTALAQLRSGDFASAITNLKTALTEDGESLTTHYYLGLALYKTNDFKQAIPHLKIAADDAYFLETEEAQWRLGLSHLKLKDANAAKAIFNEIAKDEEHSFYGEAVEILGKL